MKKHLYILLLPALLIPPVLFAQDIHFSQYYYSPATMNPSMAGAFNGDLRAGINYKEQWKSVATAYKTSAAAVDVKMFKKKWTNGFVGVGLSFFSDKAGDSEMGTTQVNLSVASTRYLNESNSIAAGFQAGYAQRSFSYDKLYWDNQYDPNSSTGYNTSLPSNESFTATKFPFFDFATGVSWNFGQGEMYSTANNQFKANAGVSYYHVNKPKYSFYGDPDERLHSKIIVHGGGLVGLKNTNTSVVPSFFYARQGGAQEIVFGTSFRYMLSEDSRYTGRIKESALSLGGHYRVGDAIIVSTMFEMSNYAVGISYDVNTSGLKAASSGKGGMEFFLRYITPNPYSRKGNSNVRFL